MDISNADKDVAIRNRAYLLWQSSGSPIGREHEFWAQAARELEGSREGGKDDANSAAAKAS